VCSGRAELREETPLCDSSWERGREQWVKSSPAGAGGRAKGGQVVLQARSSSSLQPRRGPWRSSLSLADLHVQPRRSPSAAVDEAWRRHSLWILPQEQPLAAAAARGEQAEGSCCSWGHWRRSV